MNNQEKPTARVVLARSPDQDTMQKIRSFVESQGGGEIHFLIDQSIIGGIVIYIGDKVFDGSMRSSLEHIKNSL